MKNKIKSEYEQMLKSGMFYELFPEYSGKWDQDKAQFTRFYKKRENSKKV